MGADFADMVDAHQGGGVAALARCQIRFLQCRARDGPDAGGLGKESAQSLVEFMNQGVREIHVQNNG
jgi:hypothetical protein